MARGGQGNQDGDGIGGWFYVIALLLLFLVGVYYFFHDWVVTSVFSIKAFELTLVSYLTAQYDAVLAWARVTLSQEVSLQDMRDLSYVVGDALVYPLIILTFIFSALLWFYHPKARFRQFLSMDQLTDTLEEELPYYSAKRHLVDDKEQSRAWEMALSPTEFVDKYQLLADRQVGDKSVIDRIKTHQLMVEQLGSIWQGVDQLQPHQQVLFAILSAYAQYQRGVADQLLHQIALKIKHDKRIDFKPYQPIIKRYAYNDKISKITTKHAYVYTVFTELLIQARTTGIVCTANFLWLKYIDRQLWYVLNNVGRQSVFCEAGAIRAHWLAERAVGAAIQQPIVDEAVSGLQLSL